MDVVIKIGIGVALGLALFHYPSEVLTFWALMLGAVVAFFFLKVVYEDLNKWWTSAKWRSMEENAKEVTKLQRKSLGYDE